MAKEFKRYIVGGLFFFVFVTGVLGVALYQAYDEAVTLTKQQFNEQQMLVAKQTATSVEEYLRLLSGELEILSHNPAIIGADAPICRDIFQDTYKHLNAQIITDIGLIDSSGILQVPLRVPDMIGMDFSQRNYFKEVKEAKITEPFFEFISFHGKSSGEKDVLMAKPILNNNRFHGMVLFTINITNLIKDFIPANNPSSKFSIIDSTGKILSHPLYPAGTKIDNINLDDIAFRKFIGNIKQGLPNMCEHLTPEGYRSLAASYPINIGGKSWSVIISTPDEMVSGLLGKFNRRYLIGIVSALLAIFVGSLLVLHTFNRWNIKLRREIAEREHTDRELRRAREELEQRVENRTNDLKIINEELEKVIFQHEETEEELRKQNELIYNTIESLSHPFYVIDVNNYTILLANSAADPSTQAGTKTCHALSHKRDTPCDGKEHPCTIAEIKRTGKPVVLRHQHFDNQGKLAFFDVYGYPIFNKLGEIEKVIEYNIDVTEHVQLESQLRQAQKMETIGRLAGGIAHDFNNILSAILGYSELGMMKLPTDHPVRDSLMTIKQAGKKAAVMTRHLLAFSRKQVLNMHAVNLNTICLNMVKILKRVIGAKIQLELLVDGEIGNINADPGQIEQVLMNLVINARDAMTGGGRLTIKMMNVDLDENYAKKHNEVVAGPYIMLAVTDTGVGMPPYVLENIFEPFFTTKGTGGTGLGLSTVYGIVKQHKGHISVYSEPGIGTSFKLYFPATDGAALASGVSERVETMPGGSERILLVDDEEDIVNLVIDTLQPLGYRAIGANSGRDALDAVYSTDDKFDLLLTDVVMPDMNGQELAAKVKEILPGIKVVYMTGYAEGILSEENVMPSDMVIIQKPLSPLVLSRKIREILDKEN